MRDWNYWHHQKCRGGKCGTKQLWKAKTFCTFWYKIRKSLLTQLRDSLVQPQSDDDDDNNHNKSSPKSFGKRPRRHPSLQRMNSPTACATICAMTTAGVSNNATAGTLHPHRSATCFLYVTLRCPYPQRNLLLPVGATHPTGKNHPPTHSAHHTIQHRWRLKFKFYCYCLRTIH